MKEVKNEREQKESERDWEEEKERSRERERESNDNDQRSGLACAFYVIISNVICMILCYQEKKIRKEKKERDDVVIKTDVLGEEEDDVEAENSLGEVEEQEIDNG